MIDIKLIRENKDNLYSGGIDGHIDIWEILTPEDKEASIELITTINDPELTKSNIPRINDLIILPKIFLLAFCDNNKRLYIYDINKKKIISTINRDSEMTCLSCLEAYGKLLCGTKQKMIIEVNLNDELKKAGYKEIYDKYPFSKREKIPPEERKNHPGLRHLAVSCAGLKLRAGF